jgi:hypothetical protein
MDWQPGSYELPARGLPGVFGRMVLTEPPNHGSFKQCPKYAIGKNIALLALRQNPLLPGFGLENKHVLAGKIPPQKLPKFLISSPLEPEKGPV